MRDDNPRAAAQQLPATLTALAVHQIPILLSPGLATVWMALPHRVGVPGVFTPLVKLAVQIHKAPAIHQPAAAIHPRLLRLASVAAPTKGIGRSVVLRPAAIEGVAEMKGRCPTRPAGALPLVLAGQCQLGQGLLEVILRAPAPWPSSPVARAGP